MPQHDNTIPEVSDELNDRLHRPHGVNEQRQLAAEQSGIVIVEKVEIDSMRSHKTDCCTIAGPTACARAKDRNSHKTN